VSVVAFGGLESTGEDSDHGAVTAVAGWLWSRRDRFTLGTTRVLDTGSYGVVAVEEVQ